MAIVTDISRVPGAPRARLIVLDDVPWRAVPQSVIHRLGLVAGTSIDPEALHVSVSTLEMKLGWDRAVALVGYRERTRNDITVCLESEGYAQQTIGDIVCRLESLGLVDDARFTEAAAHVLIERKGFGRSRALHEMLKHGLASEDVLSALDTYAPEETEYERACLTAQRLVRTHDNMNSLTRRLMRRGFRAGIAQHAASDTLTKETDPQEE